jgi:hypothetical protein
LRLCVSPQSQGSTSRDAKIEEPDILLDRVRVRAAVITTPLSVGARQRSRRAVPALSADCTRSATGGALGVDLLGEPADPVLDTPCVVLIQPTQLAVESDGIAQV